MYVLGRKNNIGVHNQMKRNTRLYGLANGDIVSPAKTDVRATENIHYTFILNRQLHLTFRVVYQVDTIYLIRLKQHRQHIVQFRHRSVVHHYRDIQLHSLIICISLYITCVSPALRCSVPT